MRQSALAVVKMRVEGEQTKSSKRNFRFWVADKWREWEVGEGKGFLGVAWGG